LNGDFKDVNEATPGPDDVGRRRVVTFVGSGPTLSISDLVAVRSATCTKPRKKLLSRKKNLKHL